MTRSLWGLAGLALFSSLPVRPIRTPIHAEGPTYSSAMPRVFTHEDRVAIEDFLAVNPEQKDQLREFLGLAPAAPVWIECGDSAGFFSNGVTAQAVHPDEQTAINLATEDAILLLRIQSDAACGFCPVPVGCVLYWAVLPSNGSVAIDCDPETGQYRATATYSGAYALGCTACPKPPA